MVGSLSGPSLKAPVVASKISFPLLMLLLSKRHLITLPYLSPYYRYHQPKNFHHTKPAPNQITICMTETTNPILNHLEALTYPSPK